MSLICQILISGDIFQRVEVKPYFLSEFMQSSKIKLTIVKLTYIVALIVIPAKLSNSTLQ